jgi:hypothetical protein
MKQINNIPFMAAVFAAFLLFFPAGMQSQVAIGDAAGTHPVPGSLLDLSPGSNLGLLPQQIELSAMDKIPAAFTERKGDGPATDLQGLMVYNTNTGFSEGAGLYVWDGALWHRVCTTAAPTATSPQTFFSGATIADLVATGTDIKWYEALSGGSALPTSTTLATGTYYASQTFNGCESANRVTVTVTVNPVLVKSFELTKSSLTLNNWGSLNSDVSTVSNITGSDDKPMPSADVVWSKDSEEDPITIVQTGKSVTITVNHGAAAGTYNVRATAGSISHTCAVEVRSLTSITLNPTSLSFTNANQEKTIRVSSFLDNTGATMTGMDAVSINWSIEDGTTSGTFKDNITVSAGTSQVRVVSGSASGAFSVTATVDMTSVSFSADCIVTGANPCPSDQVAGTGYCFFLSLTKGGYSSKPTCETGEATGIISGITPTVWIDAGFQDSFWANPTGTSHTLTYGCEPLIWCSRSVSGDTKYPVLCRVAR